MHFLMDTSLGVGTGPGIGHCFAISLISAQTNRFLGAPRFFS